MISTLSMILWKMMMTVPRAVWVILSRPFPDICQMSSNTSFKWEKKHSKFSPGKISEGGVSHWGQVIPPRKQILTFMWGMANQKPARAIADCFDITRSSYNRVFRRVVMAAVDLCNEYITWPTGEYHKCLKTFTHFIPSSQVLTVSFLFKFTSQEIK